MVNGELPVRPGTATDVSEVVRLGARMFQSMGVYSEGWEENARAVLQAGIEEGRMAAFVVDHPERPGELVASCAGVVWQRLPGPRTPTGRAGYIQYVFTDPEFRGRGLARRLLGALSGWFRERKVGLIELHATPEGEPLYRSMGFGEAGNPHLRMHLD
jgi:GNAT superfamily N-acetyltransferase